MHKYPKNIRLKNYDYSKPGYYFITLCTSGNRNLIHGYKTILEEELTNLSRRFTNFIIDDNVFMENHCHIIFNITELLIPLSKIIQAYKSLTTLRIKRGGYKDKRFWQPNYYEHIIRTEEELTKVKIYIKANPYKEKIDWSNIENYI